MNTKLKTKKNATALPLKTLCFEKGKKAITISKKRTPCLTNLEMISTGVVKR